MDSKQVNELAPKALLVVAGLLIAWIAFTVIGGSANDSEQFTAEEYERAIGSELSDKCATPDDYTDEEWIEHMGHHPSRYKGCFVEDETSIAYRNISPDELEILLASFEDTSDVALIDTHIPEQAHIPGTDALVPFNEISGRLDELPLDKDAPIVLYCRSGNMSEAASKELVELGYSNVYNLEGGTNAWRATGRDVVYEEL